MSESSTSHILALDAYDAYPFASDEIYQQGLANLIAGGALADNLSSEQKEELLCRTRVFYFNRVTGHALSIEEVCIHERSNNWTRPEHDNTCVESDKGAANAMDEGRVLTFAELQELIESGKVDQIPNNKTIPERFNEAPPSQSTAPTRKKPWEAASEI